MDLAPTPHIATRLNPISRGVIAATLPHALSEETCSVSMFGLSGTTNQSERSDISCQFYEFDLFYLDEIIE